MSRSSPLQRAQERMGYQTAMQRPCCRNCHHAQQRSSSAADFYPWYCNKGLFGTTAQAVCEQHQPYQKSGAK